MNEVTITGAQFRDMVCAGAALLEKNREKIDALNVFPVPDGDTGTNMCMTMQSAVKELQKLKEDCTVAEAADAVSMGALRGARGNSGVILSQLFRGFSKAFKGLTLMDGTAFANALTKGSESAYKAVMRPKEGTILTVAKAIAAKVSEEAASGCNVYRLIDFAITAGEIALAQTPEQLPVLKEAGVVDSGGKGLVTIYHGFKLYLDGEDIGEYFEREVAGAEKQTAASEAASIYGYEADFEIIHLNGEVTEKEISSFKEDLEKIGGDVSVELSDNNLKVSVKTDGPGKALQFALRYGELNAVSIANLRENERRALDERAKNEKEYAIISVSTGKGIDESFTALGVDHIISGGQTMNPSIDSIANAIYEVNAKTVFILPNNSNIIMAAQQAAKLAQCKVIVLPTKTIPQGFSAVLAFDPTRSAAANTESMKAAIAAVVSGSVTYAVRDTQFNGIAIQKGNILGMVDGELFTAKEDVADTAIETVREMVKRFGPDAAALTLFYGEGVTEEQANELSDRASEEFPDIDCIVQFGGQSLYYYYLSVE